MDVLSIESCVKSVVKAYHDATNLIKRLKGKREGTEGALPEALTKELEESLALGPPTVQGQYDHDFRRFGETYARGDAVAREQMKDVLITLQQAVLSNIREVWMDDADLDYKALMNASDDCRVNAVVCLGQLYQRMSAATAAQSHLRMPITMAGSVFTSASPSLQHSNSRSTRSSFSENQPLTPGSEANNFLRMSGGSSASGTSYAERKMSIGSSSAIPRALYSSRMAQVKENVDNPEYFSQPDAPPQDNVQSPNARAIAGQDHFSPNTFLLSAQPSIVTLVSPATDEQARSSYIGQDLDPPRPTSRDISDVSGIRPRPTSTTRSDSGDLSEPLIKVPTAIPGNSAYSPPRSASRPPASVVSDVSYTSFLRRPSSPDYSTLEHISFLEAHCRPPKSDLSLHQQQQQQQQFQQQHQQQRSQRQQQQRQLQLQHEQQRRQQLQEEEQQLHQWQQQKQEQWQREQQEQSRPSTGAPQEPRIPEPQQPQHQNEHHHRYQSQLLKYRQQFQDWEQKEVRQPIFKSQLQAQSLSPATPRTSFSSSTIRKALPSGITDRFKHSHPTTASPSKLNPELRTFMTSPTLAPSIHSPVTPRTLAMMSPHMRPRSGSTASTSTTVSVLPANPNSQARFESLPLPPVVALTLPTESNLAGFCKGAFRLQSGVNKKRAFNLEQRPSGLYNTIDIWHCSKCSFEGPAITTTAPLLTGGRWGGKAEKTFDQKVRVSEGGIRYRWVFLAKCHVPTKAIETGALKDGSFGAFGCIFCCAEGPGRGWGLGPASAGIAEKIAPGGSSALATPMFGNAYSFMQHLEMHCGMEGMPGYAMQRKTNCIVGRVADNTEDFDINLPLIGEA